MAILTGKWRILQSLLTAWLEFKLDGKSGLLVISTKMAKIENLAKVEIWRKFTKLCANGIGNGEFGLNGEHCKRSPTLAKIEIRWQKVKNTVAWSSLRLAFCGKRDI